MQCRRARRTITERRLQTLSPASERELQSHLAACAACAAEQVDERMVARELATLRREPPFRVDVTARVLRVITARRTIERRDVPVRQLGWAALATATALGVVVLVAWKGFPPLIPQAVREARWLLGGIESVASVVAVPLEALWAALHSVGELALDLLVAFSIIVNKLAIVPQAIMVFSLAVMTSITTFVIARDLGVLPSPRKELRR